jgi:hypothetical protein
MLASKAASNYVLPAQLLANWQAYLTNPAG